MEQHLVALCPAYRPNPVYARFYAYRPFLDDPTGYLERMVVDPVAPERHETIVADVQKARVSRRLALARRASGVAGIGRPKQQRNRTRHG
jgi:hypothetical protein